MVAIAVIAVTSWVLDVAADAPSLATCKPIDQGGNSALYAADGSKLGRDRLRRSAHAGLDRAHPQEPAAGDGGDRGPALLRARRHRPRGDRAAPRSRTSKPARRSRAARRSPSSWSATSASPTPSRTSNARSSRRSWRRVRRSATRRQEILGSYLNIASYGTIEGSTAVGVQAASRIYFRQAGLEADPAAGGAAGRAAAGALRIQPDPQPRGGPRAPQPGAAADGQARLHLRRSRRGGAARRASASTSPTPTSTTASPTSSTTSRTT